MIAAVQQLRKQMNEADLKIKALAQIATQYQERIKTLEAEVIKLKKQVHQKVII
jgi:chaperonin cofactor prefoldin